MVDHARNDRLSIASRDCLAQEEQCLRRTEGPEASLACDTGAFNWLRLARACWRARISWRQWLLPASLSQWRIAFSDLKSIRRDAARRTARWNFSNSAQLRSRANFCGNVEPMRHCLTVSSNIFDFSF